MKFKWPLLAKTLVPVFLFSAIVSWQAARTQAARAEVARNSLKEAQDQLRTAQERESALRLRTDRAGDDAFARAPIDRALAAVLSHTAAQREAFAVNIDQISLGAGAAGAGAAVTIRELSSTVPMAGTKLRVVKVTMRGSYNDYQQFRDFLASYSQVPAALTVLNVTARNFELTLEVLGG